MCPSARRHHGRAVCCPTRWLSARSITSAKGSHPLFLIKHTGHGAWTNGKYLEDTNK